MNFKDMTFRFLLASLLGSTSCFAENALYNTPHQKEFFVQTAPASKIDALANQPGYYQLSLSQVSPFVTYFSEYPARVTNVLPITQFSAFWTDSRSNFSKNPPNADIAGVIKTASNNLQQISLPVEIINAHYDQKHHSINYIIRPLHGDRKKVLNHMQMSYTSLFIDPWCWGCS